MARRGEGTLLHPLIGASIEADSTYTVVEALTEHVRVEDEGKCPLFIFAGPKIKFIRLVRLTCFFIIVLMYTAFSKNCPILISSVAGYLVDKNSSNISRPVTNSTADYLVKELLKMMLNGLPAVLSVVFGFMSDYSHYQRAYLLSYSFVFSACSAFCLMLCGFLITSDGTAEERTLLALISVSIIFFILGRAIFLPISLAYGLDLLEGTKWEIKYLYFPMFYVVANLGNLGGVLQYLTYESYPFNSQWYDINFSIMASILIIVILFRLFQIFPAFDRPAKFDVISFRKGIEIFWNSLKVLRTGQKSPRGHWFIQLSSEVYYGKYPRKQVQMVASFFEINFLLIFLFFLFTTSTSLLTMFPHQGDSLRFNSNLTEAYCSKEPPGTVYNLLLVNIVTVILLTPFIELYFYKIIFFFNSSENLQAAKKKKSIWRKVLKCLRCFDRYWLVYDPILKRIFWGSIFSIPAIFFAMIVEYARLQSLKSITCSDGASFSYSGLSIFSQIPQYISTGILEIVSFIGCLQFVYFQSNNTYKDQLKGLFFGLYYFYHGLATILSDLLHYILTIISYNDDNICLVYTWNCFHASLNLTWIPYGILLVASCCVSVLFAVFAHYRHHQLSNIVKRRTFLFDEEG